MNGIKALMKETQRTSLAPSAMQGHTVGGGGGETAHEAGSRASPDTEFASPQYWGAQLPER